MVRAGILATITALAASWISALSETRQLTLDDMLAVEGLGGGLFDPTGNWVIYERLRPYNQNVDYSFRTYAFAKSGHQIWRYNLEKGGQPELLPSLDPRPSSYIEGFSPNGRYLAIMQYYRGDLSISAYDMARDMSVQFKSTPAFDRTGSHNPLWISDEEIVFAALPDGREPMFTSVRGYTGETLYRRWHDAWDGAASTASEVRTKIQDESDQQEDGALILANAKTGKEQLIGNGLYADLKLSPDRRYMAALAVSKPRPLSADTLVTTDSRSYTLSVFDLSTDHERRLAPGLEFFPYTVEWAPDGTRLAAFGWRVGDEPRNGRFYAFDISSGEVTRYDHIGLDLASERERGWMQRPERTAFLGDNLAVYAREIPNDEAQAPRFSYRGFEENGLSKADWYALAPAGTHRNLTATIKSVSPILLQASEAAITVFGQEGVWRVHADGRRIKLTPELPGAFTYFPPGTFSTASGVNRPEFQNGALFNVRYDGQTKVALIDLRAGRDGQNIILPAKTSEVHPMAGSLDARTLLLSTEDNLATRLAVVADATNQERGIADLNVHLSGIDLGSWKTITYVIADPESKLAPKTINGCVLLPPNYVPGKRLPLIVDVYPGARPDCSNTMGKFSYPDPYSAYLWASRGYVYARLATPSEFITTEDGPIAGLDEVTDAGVDALVDQGIADPDQVMLFGFSQGGVSALYVATQSSKYKAVIAANSWADLFSHYFGPNGIYSYVYGSLFGNFGRYDEIEGGEFGIGETPFIAPEVYYRNSPAFLAPKIECPVMLVGTDMDSFSMSQFDEMFGALKRADKDARYVRYWGEGHALSSPANIIDFWQRVDAFLAESVNQE